MDEKKHERYDDEEEHADVDQDDMQETDIQEKKHERHSEERAESEKHHEAHHEAHHGMHEKHVKHEGHHEAIHKGEHEKRHEGSHVTSHERVHEKRMQEREVTLKIKKSHLKIGAIFVVALVVLFFGIKFVPGLLKGGNTVTPGTGTSEKVDVTVYVMSQCPYGVQFEDKFKPVYDKLKDSINFRIDYIANEAGAGSFSSLHGQGEVDGNIIQLCAAKYYPDKYYDFIACQNKNSGDLKGSIESCSKEAGIDAAKINSCFSGTEGKTLLSQSIKNSDSAGASASPTILINGQDYQGQRETEVLMRVVCNKLNNHPACKDLPACGADTECVMEGKEGKCENPGQKDAKCTFSDPIKFNMIVLNDEKCTSCDTTQLRETLKNMFIGMTEELVDIKSDKGKKLVSELKIEVVPAYILESKVIETPQWKTNSRLQSAFEKAGAYYKLTDAVTGASYYISEEARTAYLKVIGVTPGDNRPQLDFFVMSFCPYGNQAEQIIDPVYQSLKGKADFKPHYVIYSNYGDGSGCLDPEKKYCSMHGLQELNQDVRELCVDKYFGIDMYFKFVMAVNAKCSAQDADSCWEGVADSIGMNKTVKDKIKACQKDEALKLLEDEKKLGDTLKVSGSPTIFVEGEKYAGERTSAGFQTALCKGFQTQPSACSQAIAAAKPSTVPAGQCI